MRVKQSKSALAVGAKIKEKTNITTISGKIKTMTVFLVIAFIVS